MKNKFLNISIGVTLMLCGAGFLIRSVQTANAAPPRPEQFMEEGSSKIGKYQISLSTCTDACCLYTTAIVWDSETGKSKSFVMTNGGAYKPYTNNLPDSPLGE